jgi:hypothetical protein
LRENRIEDKEIYNFFKYEISKTQVGILSRGRRGKFAVDRLLSY